MDWPKHAVRVPAWLRGFGGRAPSLGATSRAQTQKRVAAELAEAGWQLPRQNEFWKHGAQLARRDNVSLVVFCSGIDRELRVTDVRDLQRSVAGRGLHPVFIYGEHLDPRVVPELVPGRDIILPVTELRSLDAAIDDLAPAMIGAVDCIETSNELSGWVKLSPKGRAHLVAQQGAEVIGACVADQYRADLLHMGDAHYAFRLQLAIELDPRDILMSVRVKAYYEERYIGLVNYWDRIVIRPWLERGGRG